MENKQLGDPNNLNVRDLIEVINKIEEKFNSLVRKKDDFVKTLNETPKNIGVDVSPMIRMSASLISGIEKELFGLKEILFKKVGEASGPKEVQ